MLLQTESVLDRLLEAAAIGRVTTCCAPPPADGTEAAHRVLELQSAGGDSEGFVERFPICTRRLRPRM
jgi:hypothetical protein